MGSMAVLSRLVLGEEVVEEGASKVRKEGEKSSSRSRSSGSLLSSLLAPRQSREAFKPALRSQARCLGSRKRPSRSRAGPSSPRGPSSFSLRRAVIYRSVTALVRLARSRGNVGKGRELNIWATKRGTARRERPARQVARPSGYPSTPLNPPKPGLRQVEGSTCSA